MADDLMPGFTLRRMALGSLAGSCEGSALALRGIFGKMKGGGIGSSGRPMLPAEVRSDEQ